MGRASESFRTGVVVQELQAARLEPLQVLVERVDEHPEGQVTLQLRGSARKTRCPRSSACGEQARQAGGSCRYRVPPPARSRPTAPERARQERHRVHQAPRRARRVARQAEPSPCAHDRAGRQDREIRVGLREPPRCRQRGRGASSTHVPLPASPPPRVARVRVGSPPSKATTAHFAVSRRPPRAHPRDARSTPSGGPSIPQRQRKRLQVLPFYVAERTTATSVSDVEIP